MSKKTIRVGIIDDDSTKITQIMSALRRCMEGAPEDVMDQYCDYELEAVDLTIKSDLNELLNEIIENKIDALIIDYQLSSYNSDVAYTGVGIADRTDQKYLGFPSFLLTSYESDLYQKEVFDAYKVFDFERYMSEDKERIELNRKIIEQYIKRQRDIKNKKEELSQLLTINEPSIEQEDRILELDDFLERSLDGDYAVSKAKKKQIIDNRFETIIQLLREAVKS